MARWLLPLTCVFGCPLLMGAVMWGLGRDRQMAKLEREIARINRSAGLARTADATPRVGPGALRQVWCSACLNWRVLGTLGVVAVVLLLVSPRLFAAAGPGLLIVVCPLSMGLAMFAMGRRGSRRTGAGGGVPAGDVAPATTHVTSTVPVNCAPPGTSQSRAAPTDEPPAEQQAAELMGLGEQDRELTTARVDTQF